MPFKDAGVHSENIRRSLFSVLQKLDPVEAGRAGPDASLSRLLELVRGCVRLPDSVMQIAVERGRDEAEPGPLCIEALDAWNAWLTANGFAQIERTAQTSPLTVTTPQFLKIQVAESCPFPRDWRPLVRDVRARLLEGIPQPPFAHWILPQPLYRAAAWTEAFAVISSEQQTNATATVLLPSEAAADSEEASEAWRARVLAAARLNAHPVRVRTALISRVIDCAAAASPAYVILEPAQREVWTLAKRIRVADPPTPPQLLELAIALCEVLGTLNAASVRVMDLRPDVVAFQHAPSLRITELLDPTAVWPIGGLVPELRLDGVSLATALSAPEAAERAQVFLIAALVLGVLRNTTQALSAPVPPHGKSSSFAMLAAAPQMVDAEPDRIAEPLIEDLRRIYPNRDHHRAIEHLVATLRWALSEEPDERYQSLPAFSEALRGVSGS